MFRSNYRLPFWAKLPKKPRGHQGRAIYPTARPARPDRKRDLAAAALRCLQREGCAALTARNIAAEAGLSLGHFTDHYPSMDALLAAAYELASEQLRAAGTQLQSVKVSPLDRLEAFLLAGFTPEFLSTAHLRMRIDLWSAALSHPTIADTERALYGRHRAELEVLLQAIAVPGKSPHVGRVSDLIMAARDGIWLDRMRRHDQIATRNALLACLDHARLTLT